MLKRALCLLALGAQLVNAQVNVAAAALVPAYIYPETATTWQPLYTQIKNYPNVKFNVIVNPESGPGAATLPDANYQREILKLRTYKNVRLVGYVAVNYTNKALPTVKAEVAKYASWPATSKNTALSVDGIFFDEAPSDAATAKITYMQSATKYTRSFASTGLSATPYVVTNPGYPPARSYLYNATDTTIVPDLSLVYEEAYATWVANEDTVDAAIWALNVDDAKLAVMLHGVPKATACADVGALVDELKGNTGVRTLWFTDDADYQVWPDATLWARYLKAFASGGTAC
ncbi:cell surface spherulin 4-like protein [Diplodia corticola]|uniref:Cell surface spherulin 4-like protein n=1 Tax=Diplodia corticola TaxID=236234 RepID=A0A1J9RCS4_9PEZI|nr:cell surface spherulin 4-like protein [Diplodia corticola]OJD37914.1 cell surface spherulin 4-like protein [Diplodia corticola]